MEIYVDNTLVKNAATNHHIIKCSIPKEDVPIAEPKGAPKEF